MDVQSLLAQLNDRDQSQETIQAVIKMGPSVVPLLLEVVAAGDYYWRARSAAIRALGKIGDARAFDVLFDLLVSIDARAEIDLVTRLRFALADLGAPIVPRLIAILKEGTPTQRANAALLLGGEMRRQEAFHSLLDALGDQDPRVRIAAAGGLGALSNRAAMEPLKELLNDPDEEVRYTVIFALGQLGDQGVVPSLFPLLKDKSHLIRSRVIETLGGLQPQNMLEPLVDILRDETEHPGVRASAANSLGKLRDSRATQPLIEALRSDEIVIQEYALGALTMIDDLDAKKTLFSFIDNRNHHLADIAISWAGETKNPDAVGLLAEQLKGGPSRKYAAKALAAIGTGEALEVLSHYTDTIDRDVREIAVDALNRDKNSRNP